VATYTVSKNNTLSANQGTIARVAPSAGAGVGVVAFAATDEEAAASVRRLTLERTTGGTVATAQTPEKLRAESRAADSAGAIDFSAAPTISGSPLITLSYQNIATGPSVTRHWRAHPRFPVMVDPSAFCTLRGTNLAIPVTRTLWFSEPEDTPNWSLRGRRPIRPGYWFHQDHAVAVSSLATNPMRNRVLPAFHIVDDATWVYPTPAPNLAALIDSLGGGGATFPQALTAAATGTAALVLQPGKLLAATGTGTASLLKSIGKALGAGGTGTATLVRLVGKVASAGASGTATLAAVRLKLVALTATASGTATLIRQTTKLLSAGATGTPTLRKIVGKALSVAGTGTATLAAIKTKIVTLLAAATGAASLIRRTTKALIVGASGTPTLTRAIGKALAVGGTAAATLARAVTRARTLAASATGTATIARSLSRTLTLVASATGTATLTRTVGKRLAALAVGTAALAKRVDKVLLAAATGPTALVARWIPANFVSLANTVGAWLRGGAGTLADAGTQGEYDRPAEGEVAGEGGGAWGADKRGEWGG
jgi:hypothetical protein